MKCFNHPERDAVGVCRHCQKGLCPDCLTLVNDTVACSTQACQQQVALLDQMLDRSRRVYGNMGKQWGPTIVTSGLGGIFILSAGLVMARRTPAGFAIAGVGAAMLFAGVLAFVQSRKMKKMKF